MPELPEVETTRRGLEGQLAGRRIVAVRVREARLRRPISKTVTARLRGANVIVLRRRAKYLLLDTDRGTALVHLGMSGSLRLAAPEEPPNRHDHYDLVLANATVVRYRDPRRFGLLLWAGTHPERYPLLAELGPEPLSPEFDGEYLFRRSRGRRVSIKALLMDGKFVAGIGNIYANEALYRAAIHPGREAGKIGSNQYSRLAEAIQTVLAEAIADGGTTLRDFVAAEGRPGYFRPRLAVYQRAGEACRRCGYPIRCQSVAQRASYFCPRCQPLGKRTRPRG